MESGGIASYDRVEALLRRVARDYTLAREEGRPFWLVVPGACACGRTLELDLTQFDHVELVDSAWTCPAIAFTRLDGERRLEYRIHPNAADDPGIEGVHAPGIALVELIERLEALELHGPYDRRGALRGTRAWSSWEVPCPHGRPVPLIRLGQRAIPAWCARTRFEGELSLLGEPSWPGVEACERCPWHRGASEGAVSCAAEGVELGAEGMCLEVDVFRQGRKRRGFVPLDGDVAGAVRTVMRPAEPLKQRVAEIDLNPFAANAPPAGRPRMVDVKFVIGEARRLEREPDAFMERWRFYWNGEDWVRKPPGAPLHDWNKWGRDLEFVSVAEPGGLPPPAGWPAVLDLPEGPYLLRVLSLHWTVGRRGEPELEWTLKVLDGPHRGRRVFRRSPVRTPGMEQLVIRDLSMVLGCREREIARPGQPGFDALLPRVRGIAVLGRVAKKDAFTNLYLDGRAAKTR
jgi:hypothetical protein